MITLKRLSAVLIFLALTSTVVVTRQMPATAAPNDEVEEALDAYETRLTPLVDAIGELHHSQKVHQETIEQVSFASASLEAARQRLDENRSRFAAIAVYAYMDRGGRGIDAEAGSQRGVALASSRLRSDERDVRDAQNSWTQLGMHPATLQVPRIDSKLGSQHWTNRRQNRLPTLINYSKRSPRLFLALRSAPTGEHPHR